MATKINYADRVQVGSICRYIPRHSYVDKYQVVEMPSEFRSVFRLVRINADGSRDGDVFSYDVGSFNENMLPISSDIEPSLLAVQGFLHMVVAFDLKDELHSLLVELEV